MDGSAGPDATRNDHDSVTQPNQGAPMLAHIQRLANEEHRLLEQGELGPEENQRLAALQTELDQLLGPTAPAPRAARVRVRPGGSPRPRCGRGEEIHRMR